MQQTFRSVAAGIVIACGCHAAAHADQIAISPPTNYYAISVVADNEMSQRESFGRDCRKHLLSEDYSWLEDLANVLRTQKTRYPDGDWKLRWFYSSFKEPSSPDDEVAWISMRSRLVDWCKAKPESVSARISLAVLLTGYAWNARGDDWAANTSEASMKLMQTRLEQAAQALKAAQQLPSKCPHWYAAALRIGLGQGWDRTAYDRVYNEAVTLEPTYYAFYEYKATYLAPRWYGAEGDWATYVNTLAKSGKPEDQVISARVIWSITRSYQVNPYRECSITWAVAKKGFLEWTKAYPDSLEVKSAFCLSSGYAGDCYQMKSLFAEIGNSADLAVWVEEQNFLKKRAWAFKKCQ